MTSNSTAAPSPAPGGSIVPNDAVLAVALILAAVCVAVAVIYIIVEVKYLRPKRNYNIAKLGGGDTESVYDAEPGAIVKSNARYAPRRTPSQISVSRKESWKRRAESFKEKSRKLKQWKPFNRKAAISKTTIEENFDEDVVNEHNHMHFEKREENPIDDKNHIETNIEVHGAAFDARKKTSDGSATDSGVNTWSSQNVPPEEIEMDDIPARSEHAIAIDSSNRENNSCSPIEAGDDHGILYTSPPDADDGKRAYENEGFAEEGRGLMRQRSHTYGSIDSADVDEALSQLEGSVRDSVRETK